jgi:hypothetical protein
MLALLHRAQTLLWHVIVRFLARVWKREGVAHLRPVYVMHIEGLVECKNNTVICCQLLLVRIEGHMWLCDLLFETMLPAGHYNMQEAWYSHVTLLHAFWL